MSEIKWAYDTETGSFSALPASPWLLPALGLFLLAPIAQKIAEEAAKDPRPLGDKFDPGAYMQNKLNYHHLTRKKASPEGLTLQEELELISIMNPPWAEPGELWTY
ncbi:MAG: hypothetical protein ACO253_07995 [Burkholderiaceae bacterium]